VPQDSDVPGHVHDAGDVYGEFDDDVEFGDLRSYNWDGGSDLSGGADATATKGYLGDASAGALQVQTLYAEGGLIGGWVIGATTLTGGEAILSAAGKLTIGSGNDTVMLSATNATYRLWVGDASGPSAPFRVTKAGALVATSATITGAITATSGSLSGLSVTGTLTLSGSGEIITAAAGQRISITAANLDRINLYTGRGDETAPGYLLAWEGDVDNDQPVVILAGPSHAGVNPSQLYLFSNYTAQLVGYLTADRLYEGSLGGAAKRVYSANNWPVEAISRTISGGVIDISGTTAPTVVVTVDTEGGAATDDLDSISGGTTNQIVILKTASAARDVVVKHSTTYLALDGAADVTLGTIRDRLVLISHGGANLWAQIGGGTNG